MQGEVADAKITRDVFFLFSILTDAPSRLWAISRPLVSDLMALGSPHDMNSGVQDSFLHGQFDCLDIEVAIRRPAVD